MSYISDDSWTEEQKKWERALVRNVTNTSTVPLSEVAISTLVLWDEDVWFFAAQKDDTAILYRDTKRDHRYIVPLSEKVLPIITTERVTAHSIM